MLTHRVCWTSEGMTQNKVHYWKNSGTFLQSLKLFQNETFSENALMQKSQEKP
jgi:hypothetical protein